MARFKQYLVPIDFSKGSEAALDHALSLARDDRAGLILLHVIPGSLVYPTEGTTFDLSGLLERDAHENFRRLARRKKLKPSDCRFVVARGTDFAEAIVREAKKLRTAMIVMGSHGRTGLQRLLLGSVAERTLRYADCPVLIVTK
jgi:nucleotide-binding universal stress UspA family protein